MTGAGRLPVDAVSTRAEAVRVSPRLQVGHSPHEHGRNAERESKKRTRGSGCTNVSVLGGGWSEKGDPRVGSNTDTHDTISLRGGGRIWVAGPDSLGRPACKFDAGKINGYVISLRLSLPV